MPEPYYQDDVVTIYHGDCREILPTLAADALITDPPYGTNYYPTDTDTLSVPLFREWLEGFEAVAVFGWPEKLTGLCSLADHNPSEWITWWPINGRSRGFNRLGLWREVECIAWFGKAEWGRLRQPRTVTTTKMPNPGVRGNKDEVGEARMGDVWRDASPNLNPNQPPRLHPNEKPVSVMRKLLTVSDGTVVDPFMGSGTTLRAAKDLGRRAIGIEVEERYCEVAANRMCQDVMDFGAAA